MANYKLGIVFIALIIVSIGYDDTILTKSTSDFWEHGDFT